MDDFATRRQSVRQRDAAMERLKSITTNTALAGIIGTGAFGVLAAANYSGQPAATDNGASTTDGGTLSNGSTSNDDGSGATTDDGSSSTNRDSSGFAPIPVNPRAATGRAHTSSGGS